MELVKQVLGMTFEWGALAGLIVGTVGGIVIGALPGFSASMGVALLIPITYGMSPVAGLIMLTAVYTSAIYGGSITTTLCHTPGTPASAATAIDGYKLTQQGRGMEAVGVCTVASMIGGVVGAGIGSALGGLAGGQNVGSALLNGAGSYWGNALDQEDWAKKLMEQNPLKPQGWGGGFRAGGSW